MKEARANSYLPLVFNDKTLARFSTQKNTRTLFFEKVAPYFSTTKKRAD